MRVRRSGVPATIGLVVEGDAEFAAFPRLHSHKLIAGCPPIKATNLHCVGSDREPIGIARLIAPKVIAHQVAGRERVIVCFDREQRTVCAPELAKAVAIKLREVLRDTNRSDEGVSVVVADRAFEAWLLAGAHGLHAKRLLKSVPSSWTSFEGKPGRENKKGVAELETLLGRPYSKTVDGPELFCSLSFPDARAYADGALGSRSLDKFLRELGCLS